VLPPGPSQGRSEYATRAVSAPTNSETAASSADRLPRRARAQVGHNCTQAHYCPPAPGMFQRQA
jgi:hypothetical protein